MARRLGKIVTGAAPVDAAHPREPRVPALAKLSTDLRTLFVNLFLLLAVVVLVPVIAAQFGRTQVLIEPIAVPAALAARGLDGNVAANRLWDGIDQATTAAATSKAGIRAIPAAERVDFSIPDSGLSIDALVYYVRQFFHGYETRISGDLSCSDNACTPSGITLRLRILRDRLDVIQLPPLGAKSENDYFLDAGIDVLSRLDPFTAAAALADGQPTRAMAQAERLLETHSADAKWAANLIGNLKLTAGDADGAITAFQRALNLDPDFLIAKTNLASALTDKKDFAGAQAILAHVAQADPNNLYLSIASAKLAAARGDLDGALKMLSEADARDPGTPRYNLIAAQVALKANRLPDVVQYADRVLLLDPANYDAVTMIYAIHVAQGSPDQAEAALNHALDYQPDADAIESELALVLIAESKFLPALHHIEHALSEAPTRADYQLTRARILHYLGRDGEALPQLDATALIDPDDPKVAMTYGDVYAALGRATDAAAAYQQVVTANTDPDDVARAQKAIAQIHVPAASAG
jgi:predicted Zn-dependent protease